MRELLKKIGIEKTDREYLLRAHETLGDEIRVIAEEFYSVRGLSKDDSYKRAVEYGKRAEALATEEFHKYTLHLLFWIYCIPLMEKDYEKKNIPEEILYETMSDLSCKVRECRELYGVPGTFEDWYFLFTDIILFGLGRLQYEIAPFAAENYKKGDIELKKGDRVYFCHIPSTGKLTKELYMDSFHRAYEFFKDELNGTVIPIVCHSYLFWPPYMEKVFDPESNTAKFVKEFDILFWGNYETFGDCWRIFGRRFEGTTDKLARETELQRRFIKYIDEGGDFGHGYGVLLYDGEKREIIR